ncbi:hypothetical protein Krac_0332 [Ktedonobacter racemifer DSM 44963]|uniref:Uncharacterized protein n=1 Tax=Ktedonobacter racemifer DSM 44963 TaxID=485913 RepID=D6U7F9_KTERA|nr:hypothetical protein Krac_0332 [Ktedonobacter racemifer DSM 44963]
MFDRRLEARQKRQVGEMLRFLLRCHFRRPFKILQEKALSVCGKHQGNVFFSGAMLK